MHPDIHQIAQQIIDHPHNAWAAAKGYTPVFTAHPSATLMIVGQAPGIKAQLSHNPWNDLSGIRLRSWLNMPDDIFYNTEIVALVPMDFYYPGKGKSGDLPPRAGFAEMWHPPLRAAMPNIKLTLLVGQYSQRYYLGSSRGATLTETVARFQDYLPDFMPLPHPSPRNLMWLRRNNWFEQEVVPQLQKRVGQLLG